MSSVIEDMVTLKAAFIFQLVAVEGWHSISDQRLLTLVYLLVSLLTCLPCF